MGGGATLQHMVQTLKVSCLKTVSKDHRDFFSLELCFSSKLKKSKTAIYQRGAGRMEVQESQKPIILAAKTPAQVKKKPIGFLTSLPSWRHCFRQWTAAPPWLAILSRERSRQGVEASPRILPRWQSSKASSGSSRVSASGACPGLSSWLQRLLVCLIARKHQAFRRSPKVCAQEMPLLTLPKI